MSERGALLLTGATGFVGMELLARALERSEQPVRVLVRASSDEEAQCRIDGVLRSLVPEPPPPGRVVALAGDLEAPGVGLSEPATAQLADEVTTVVHCAASVSFALPLPESRAVNVDGTRRKLELARVCASAGDGLDRFAYVSTAYVSGRHRGVFGPADLDRGQRFRNPYECSKQEAEALVRRAGEHLPVQVFRPSIVVGDRRTGWTNSFNVIYQPLRAFSRGMYSVLPGRLDAPVDVVPVDYVADAIWTLTRQPFSSPETHLLVSGEQAATVGELAELASGYFGRPAPRVVDPVVFRLAIAPRIRRRGGSLARAVLEHSSVYFPYFQVETWFDDSATRDALRPHGVRAAPLCAYFNRLAAFAVSARWGKRTLTRAQALG